MSFIHSMTMPQLGRGAGYAVWAFRAIAIGHGDCPSLLKGYEMVFGDHHRPALGAVQLLVRAIGNEAGRRFSVGAPGCCGVTADEVCLVAMLAAAQDYDADRRDAHVRWLTIGKGGVIVQIAADAVGAAFRKAGLSIDQPPVELKTNHAMHSAYAHHAPGHA